MNDFKGTPGQLEPKFVSGVCIGIGTVGDYTTMTANTILPDTDEEYEKQESEILANMKLYASSPDLIKALQKAKQIICSLKLSMLVHPDCTEGSEFDDFTSTAQETEDEIQLVIDKALGKEMSSGC